MMTWSRAYAYACVAARASKRRRPQKGWSVEYGLCALWKHLISKMELKFTTSQWKCRSTML